MARGRDRDLRRELAAAVQQAGIELEIETGKGSAVSATRVGSGGTPMGIADLPTAMQARGKTERFSCIYHNWTYDHAAKRISITQNVRVILRTQLNDILK